MVLLDGHIQRPPVTDYKFGDVSDLGYFATDWPYPRGELVVKTRSCSPATTSDPNDRRALRRRRLLPDRRRDGRDRPRPAGLRRPPQQRAQARRRASSSRRQAGSRLRQRRRSARSTSTATARSPICWRLSCRRTCNASTGAQVGDRRVAADRRPSGEPAVLRGSAGLHRRDHTVHPGERAADRNPQAGLAEAQAALRRAPRAALRRPGRQARPTSCRELRHSGADAPVLETVSRAAAAMLGTAKSDLHTRRPLHRLGWGLVVGVDIRQPAARDLRVSTCRSV